MPSQIRPIRPDEAKPSVPDFVVEAVNELINEHYRNRHFFIKQALVVERIRSKTAQDFDYAWLDFEPLYREAGWDVRHEQPCIGDNFEAYFTFDRK